MRTIIRFVLLTALRDRLFIALLALLIAATGICSVLANTAMLEQHEMALSFSSAVARLLLAIGITVFVCFHLRYAFDSKEIDVMLSRPISRSQLVLAYWGGFAVMAALLVAACSAVMAVLRPDSWQGLAVWSVSLLLEMWIVVAVALFASVTLRSAVTSVMASFTFYVVGRMMGFFLATVQSKMVFQQEWLNVAARFVIEGIALITPRLDMFAKSSWLSYRPEQLEWLLFMAQSPIYVALLLTATVLDFRRRQF